MPKRNYCDVCEKTYSNIKSHKKTNKHFNKKLIITNKVNNNNYKVKYETIYVGLFFRKYKLKPKIETMLMLKVKEKGVVDIIKDYSYDKLSLESLDIKQLRKIAKLFGHTRYTLKSKEELINELSYLSLYQKDLEYLCRDYFCNVGFFRL